MNNLISKQKVLNTLDFIDKACIGEERTVEKYKELLTECIEVLPSDSENPNKCGDLISRKDAIQELKAGGLEELFKSLGVYPWNVIKMIPSADVRENIHGTWEEWKVGKYEGVPICSVCKHGFPLGFNQYNFCPNCGADMRGE